MNAPQSSSVFIGQVRHDGAPWQEVCRCATFEACRDMVIAWTAPKGTIVVEHRVIQEPIRGQEETLPNDGSDSVSNYPTA
jgi:hypothetical protein